MRKTKSAILDAVHETAMGLRKAGVMNLVALREFDQLRLPHRKRHPQQNKAVQERNGMLESPNEDCLNTSKILDVDPDLHHD